MFIFVCENICFLSELLSCKTLKFYATYIAHSMHSSSPRLAVYLAGYQVMILSGARLMRVFVSPQGVLVVVFWCDMSPNKCPLPTWRTPRIFLPEPGTNKNIKNIIYCHLSAVDHLSSGSWDPVKIRNFDVQVWQSTFHVLSLNPPENVSLN